MKDFLQFASDSPWLTFFLFLVISSTVVGVARAITSPWRKVPDEGVLWWRGLPNRPQESV